MFKNISTLVLKVAIVILGLIVIALCIFALPSIWKGGSIEFPEADDAPCLVVIGFAIACAPFVIAAFANVFQKILQDGLDIKLKN